MYFDELNIGMKVDTEPALIRKEKMIEFAKDYDNIPLHTDEEYAKTTHFGQLIAPGMMSFMAVWANENWTRTWDGMENSVLIEQKYSQDDPRQFILDLKKYIDDSRYIRVEGKPVIGLYAPYAIPDVKMVLEKRINFDNNDSVV